MSCFVRSRMWLREYEVFVNEGSELEALDSLLQTCRKARITVLPQTVHNFA